MKTQIGAGTYGQVYKLDENLAVKELRSLTDVPGIEEIAALTNINSPYVLSLDALAFRQDLINDSDLIIYTDILTRLYQGDIYHFIATERPDDLTRKRLSYQVIQGLADMHHKGWLHRDLKPNNILYQREPLTAIIADLGMAKRIALHCTDCNPEVTTLPYRAPELLLGSENYSYPIDIWSLGLNILYLMTGIVLRGANNESEQLSLYFQFFGQPDIKILELFEKYPSSGILLDQPEEVSPSDIEIMMDNPRLTLELFEVIKRICHYDPIQRPNAEEILAFKFFDDIRPPRFIPVGLNYKIYLIENLLLESSLYPLVEVKESDDRIPVLDWLYITVQRFGFKDRTYQQTIYLLDKNRSNFDILDVFAALYIVSALNEEGSLTLLELVMTSKNSFSKEQIIQRITELLNNPIVFITPADLQPLLFPDLKSSYFNILVALLLIKGENRRISAEQISYGIAYYLGVKETSRFMPIDLEKVVIVLQEARSRFANLKYIKF